MNRHEQISALLDGELSEADLQSIIESVDAEDLQSWSTYSLIGDLVRSSELASFHSPGLLASIESQLAQQPTVMAPVLATKAARARSLPRLLGQGRARFVAASLMAVGFVSFALIQTVPPLESKVQVVQGQAAEGNFTDEEIALWQEYFMAHQQNIVRGGLAGVAPLARVEADLPVMDNSEAVILDNASAGAWMNVWEAPAQSEAPVRFNYVSSSR